MYDIIIVGGFRQAISEEWRIPVQAGQKQPDLRWKQQDSPCWRGSRIYQPELGRGHKLCIQEFTCTGAGAGNGPGGIRGQVPEEHPATYKKYSAEGHKISRDV
jgi:hypothetical protein